MSINWGNVFQAVMAGINVAKKIGAGKTGKEKLQIALDNTNELIDALETGLDKDLLNNAKVAEAQAAAVSAVYEFKKAYDAAKQAKGTGGQPQ